MAVFLSDATSPANRFPVDRVLSTLTTIKLSSRKPEIQEEADLLLSLVGKRKDRLSEGEFARLGNFLLQNRPRNQDKEAWDGFAMRVRHGWKQ